MLSSPRPQRGPALIVADTNLIADLLIRGERTELAESAYQKEPHWAAPPGEIPKTAAVSSTLNPVGG